MSSELSTNCVLKRFNNIQTTKENCRILKVGILILERKAFLAWLYTFAVSLPFLYKRFIIYVIVFLFSLNFVDMLYTWKTYDVVNLVAISG